MSHIKNCYLLYQNLRYYNINLRNQYYLRIMKVLIIQGTIPEYRVAVFNNLAKKVNLTVLTNQYNYLLHFS